MLVKTESTSAHWYNQDGSPNYVRIGKNGKERTTTVADARKEGLLPSVTTIIANAPKPMLENWKTNIRLDIAYENLPIPSESIYDWKVRVNNIYLEKMNEIMGRGTEMHNFLELYFTGVYMINYPTYVTRTSALLTEYFGEQDWIAEESFAHNGYAGKVDLHSKNGIVVDFKTKESLEKASVYDDHILQLSAYAQGLKMPNARCAIVFVSDQETKICEIEPKDLEIGYSKFLDLLSYFKKDKNI